MTPATFRRIRTERLKLDQAELAALLRIEDRRTISRYETGARGISGPVSLLMEHMDMYGCGYLPTWGQQP
jgi:transcriptional regulator with XRE-family HTH domain